MLDQTEEEPLELNQGKIIRQVANADLVKNLSKSYPQLTAQKVATLAKILRKMTEQDVQVRLTPEKFAETLAIYDKEILGILPIQQIVKNVALQLDRVIALLEAQIKHANIAEKAIIKKALGVKNAALTDSQIRNPVSFYALQQKIRQKSDDDKEDFNFARQVMGDLRRITLYELGPHKLMASKTTKILDTSKKLMNRFRNDATLESISAAGIAKLITKEVEQGVRRGFK